MGAREKERASPLNGVHILGECAEVTNDLSRRLAGGGPHHDSCPLYLLIIGAEMRRGPRHGGAVRHVAGVPARCLDLVWRL